MSDLRTGSGGADFQPWKMPNFDGDSLAGMPGSAAERSELARKEAWEEGFEKGRQEGLESVRQATREKARLLAEVVDSLNRHVQEFDEQIARDIAALSARIAEQIVQRELSLSPELLLDIVQRLIRGLPAPESSVVIYLHPADLQAIQEYTREFAERDWKMLEDPMLNPGDCRLEAADSVVHGTVNNQIESILASVLEPDADDNRPA